MPNFARFLAEAFDAFVEDASPWQSLCAVLEVNPSCHCRVRLSAQGLWGCAIDDSASGSARGAEGGEEIIR